MDAQNSTIDSTTTDHWTKASYNDPNETPTVNSTNPNYNPSAYQNNSLNESTIDKTKTDLKKGQQSAEDIITKSKRLLKQQFEQTRQSIVQLQRKVKEMVPKHATDLIYWQNPVHSGIVFGVLLSIIITFMFLSSLAAVSFWLLASLVVVGLYKLYNYVMATFVGRVQDDVLESIFSSDVHISERQAHAFANYVRANGTTILRQARNLFLWHNLTNSIIFGFALFASFYIGLSMNALTFALVGLVFLFTVPKIYQVYQVPIDRVAQQILDQVNQVTSKASVKPKKA